MHAGQIAPRFVDELENVHPRKCFLHEVNLSSPLSQAGSPGGPQVDFILRPLSWGRGRKSSDIEQRLYDGVLIWRCCLWVMEAQILAPSLLGHFCGFSEASHPHPPAGDLQSMCSLLSVTCSPAPAWEASSPRRPLSWSLWPDKQAALTDSLTSSQPGPGRFLGNHVV